MLIHEKGMVAAMKKAAGASGQGLHVAAWKEDGRLWVFLYTNFWCAASAWEKLPRKVKGLLAEYMGELPGAGDAVEITKKKRRSKRGAHFCGTDNCRLPGGHVFRRQSESQGNAFDGIRDVYPMADGQG